MANQEYAEQLARAWALHRQGQNEGAIREFSSLLQTSPNHIDALYGLGLAQRSAGQIETAQATFERCIAQIAAALAEHPSEDRYEMLQKLANQRLAEIMAVAQ